MVEREKWKRLVISAEQEERRSRMEVMTELRTKIRERMSNAYWIQRASSYEAYYASKDVEYKRKVTPVRTYLMAELMKTISSKESRRNHPFLTKRVMAYQTLSSESTFGDHLKFHLKQRRSVISGKEELSMSPVEFYRQGSDGSSHDDSNLADKNNVKQTEKSRGPLRDALAEDETCSYKENVKNLELIPELKIALQRRSLGGTSAFKLSSSRMSCKSTHVQKCAFCRKERRLESCKFCRRKTKRVVVLAKIPKETLMEKMLQELKFEIQQRKQPILQNYGVPKNVDFVQSKLHLSCGNLNESLNVESSGEKEISCYEGSVSSASDASVDDLDDWDGMPSHRPSTSDISADLEVMSVMSSEQSMDEHSVSILMEKAGVGVSNLHKCFQAQREDAHERLHLQIVDFHTKSAQVFTTRRPFREALLRNVTEIIKNLWPAVEVGVYGSYAARLHLGSSDIDLVVKAGLPHSDNIANPEIYCGQLANHFDSLQLELSWIMEIKVLQHLPIPLVKVAYDSIMSFMFSLRFASLFCFAVIISYITFFNLKKCSFEFHGKMNVCGLILVCRPRVTQDWRA